MTEEGNETKKIRTDGGIGDTGYTGFGEDCEISGGSQQNGCRASGECAASGGLSDRMKLSENKKQRKVFIQAVRGRGYWESCKACLAEVILPRRKSVDSRNGLRFKYLIQPGQNTTEQVPVGDVKLKTFRTNSNEAADVSSYR
jgi:hypothetical protein